MQRIDASPRRLVAAFPNVRASRRALRRHCALIGWCRGGVRGSVLAVGALCRRTGGRRGDGTHLRHRGAACACIRVAGRAAGRGRRTDGHRRASGRSGGGDAARAASGGGGVRARRSDGAPTSSSDYTLGVVTVIQREPSVWVAVDYERVGSRLPSDRDDRLRERQSTLAVAAQVDTITRALDLSGRRNALRAAGNSRPAMEPALAAETLLRGALGADHPLTLNAGTNIASLHWDLDEFVLARERYESAIPRIAATLGPDHFHVWRARQNLALVLWDLGELDQAEAMLRQVADRYAALLDPNDAHRLGTLTNLGTLLSPARPACRGRAHDARRYRPARADAGPRSPTHDDRAQQSRRDCRGRRSLRRRAASVRDRCRALPAHTRAPSSRDASRAAQSCLDARADGPPQRGDRAVSRSARRAARGDRRAAYRDTVHAATTSRFISRPTGRSTRRSDCSARSSRPAKRSADRPTSRHCARKPCWARWKRAWGRATQASSACVARAAWASKRWGAATVSCSRLGAKLGTAQRRAG